MWGSCHHGLFVMVPHHFLLYGYPIYIHRWWDGAEQEYVVHRIAKYHLYGPDLSPMDCHRVSEEVV